MTTEKVHFTEEFTKEKETMLMTLSSRAPQSQWEHPILRDPWAEEAMRHIDYDMSRTPRCGGWNVPSCTDMRTEARNPDLEPCEEEVAQHL